MILQRILFLFSTSLRNFLTDLNADFIYFGHDLQRSRNFQFRETFFAVSQFLSEDKSMANLRKTVGYNRSSSRRNSNQATETYRHYAPADTR